MECLVAAFILAIGVVGVAGMFVYAGVSERKAAYLGQARELAHQTLEDVRAQGYTFFADSSGVNTVPTPGLPRSTGALAWQPYPDSSSEAGLKLVSVNLTWDWAGPTGGSYYVTTLVSEKGG
jgi:Tfp pilus assembly protein PilV